MTDPIKLVEEGEWLPDESQKWTSKYAFDKGDPATRLFCAASDWMDRAIAAEAAIRELVKERDEARAEVDVLRELMNAYNVGGWTDAIAPMKRALTAEAALAAERERAEAAEKDVALAWKLLERSHATMRDIYYASPSMNGGPIAELCREIAALRDQSAGADNSTQDEQRR